MPRRLKTVVLQGMRFVDGETETNVAEREGEGERENEREPPFEKEKIISIIWKNVKINWIILQLKFILIL